MQCRVKKTAPWGMDRGSAASDLQYAYFIPYGSYSVYRYEWSTEKWDKLPPCPYCDSALVIIDGALTAVRGNDGYHVTNKLFTFRERDVAFSIKLHKTYRRWVGELPPMKTLNTCIDLTAVSTSDREYVVVIGGYGGCMYTSVELFQVSNRRWYTLTDLPQFLIWPSAIICGNHMHVIGSYGDGFSCSLQDLPSSDQPTTSQSRSHAISWSPLPPLPVIYSTAATLCGHPVIVGGVGGRSPVNSIHQLVDGQWVEIGSMSSDRWLCLVVSPSPDKLMIVSGVETGSVEECAVR